MNLKSRVVVEKDKKKKKNEALNRVSVELLGKCKNLVCYFIRNNIKCETPSWENDQNAN